MRTGQEPLVVSEFGNWGLPELPDPLPWWFPRDFDGRAITRPAGLYDRFKGFAFDRLFPDYKALAHEAQWRQFQSLQHEIEEIRRQGAIRGYVITEFTDINWEANGLMDDVAAAQGLRRGARGHSAGRRAAAGARRRRTGAPGIG